MLFCQELLNDKCYISCHHLDEMMSDDSEDEMIENELAQAKKASACESRMLVFVS